MEVSVWEFACDFLKKCTLFFSILCLTYVVKTWNLPGHINDFLILRKCAKLGKIAR